MNKEALIIFVKNPELGKVKTRLAATIGDEKALEIYKLLLNHTKKITQHLPQDKWVFYSNYVDNNDLWDDNIYQKEVQSMGDLGEKMLDAFKHCFNKGYDRVCIIGSDMMEINENIIQKAFASINATVIGPAKDGGYYLLGMNKLYPYLFEHKRWSSESVLKDTLSDFNENQLSYSTLEVLNDIDTQEDWESYLASH